jgi:hypothetical protein
MQAQGYTACRASPRPPNIEPFGECKPFLPLVLATIPLKLPEQPLETSTATGTALIER